MSRRRRAIAVAGLLGAFGFLSVPAASVAASVPVSAPRLAVGATPDATPDSTVGDTTIPRASIVLSLSKSEGTKRTYVATVTRDGKAITDGDMDLGGLSDNPDVRIRTTQMVAIPGRPGSYEATLDFPANGWWILSIRAAGPSLDQVDLFTVEMTGVNDTSGHADSPSRRALAKIDPTFNARYDPNRLNAGQPLSSDELAAAILSGNLHTGASTAGGSSTSHTTTTGAPDRFEPMLLAWGFVHTLGAIAWAITVLGLVIANRVGIGATRARLIGAVSQRYFLLSAGGLVTVALSGISLAQNSPLGPGLVQLKATGLGLAYLLVFTAKMGLAVSALITSARIGSILKRLPAPAWRLRSLAAAADDNDAAKVLRLAEANALFLGLILACVVVLNNLHHAIH